MPKEMTRRELYDLVWSQPVAKAASQLGISDVALAKICKKHGVPVPGRGYWAKVAAGKPVKQILLREVQDGELNEIRIHGSAAARLPAAVIEARQKAKAEAQARQAQSNRPSSEPAAQVHPVIERLKQAMEKAKPRSDGFIHLEGGKLLPVTVAPASAPRVAAILASLLAAAAARGYVINETGKHVSLLVEGEPISLAVTEKLDKLPHRSTEAETAALQRWETAAERKRRRGEWVSDWDKPRIPEWEYAPNGLLVLHVDQGQHWDGLRRNFADGKRRRLELMLDQVLTAAATCAAARKARREAAERQKREWEEQERRRREAERRMTLEKKRWEFLERQMKLQERAQRLQVFVRDYVSRHPEGEQPESVRQLIVWARRQVEALHTAIHQEELAKVIDQHRLMDDSTQIDSWTMFE